VLFVDEIDSLFFADVPTIRNAKLISAILLLNKYKVIGMTATFRGKQGLNKMKAFLKDSAVIKTGVTEPERKLQLEVFGRLKADEIRSKVIEIAKAKQKEMSVIAILPSIIECEEMEHHF
jgi:hypothetical protein